MNETQKEQISEFNGFLNAFKSYSNYTYLFAKCTPEETKIISAATLQPVEMPAVQASFRNWLMNSLHEWFSDEFHYTPNFDIHFWQSKAGFDEKEKIIRLNWDKLSDTLIVDIFRQKQVQVYKGLWGNAVVSESWLLESEGEFYYLSFGWDD